MFLFAYLFSEEYYQPQKVDTQTLTLSGTIQSSNSTTIKSPHYWNISYRIIYLIKEGTYVSKGDTLIKFDHSQAKENLKQAQNQLQKHLYQKKIISKKNSNQIRQIKDQIKKTELNIKSTQTKLEQAKYSSKQKKKNIKLDLKRARTALEKQKRHLRSQKMINQKKMQAIQFKINQATQKVDFHQELINSLTITAPKEGLVVYEANKDEDEKQLARGSKISPDRPLLKIPNLSNMIVKAHLNEVDRFKIDSGQKAQIKLAAFPDTTFKGHLSYISPLPKRKNSKSKLKVYPFEIKIDSEKNYRLKPGLSARIEIIIDDLNNYYSIPSWCIFKPQDRLGVKTTQGKFLGLDTLQILNGKAYFRYKPGIENNKLIPNQNIPDF